MRAHLVVPARRLAGAGLLALAAAGVALVPAPSALAAGGGAELETPLIDPSNEKSLQNGAKAFVNICMGCHSAGYNRYSRVAQDLGLSEEDVERNLIFTTDENGEPTKIGSLMTNNMTKEYGQQAFGVMPPNLSLTARSRGEDWIYTMLKSYYLDPDRAGTGVNNVVWPGTAMPHVLWNEQGWAEAVVEEVNGAEVVVGTELVEPGQMTPEEYEDYVADITNFLSYMANPIREESHRIGFLVMLFLAALLGVAYFLKKEYWKDVV